MMQTIHNTRPLQEKMSHTPCKINEGLLMFNFKLSKHIGAVG
jgi:hypothetical protein